MNKRLIWFTLLSLPLIAASVRVADYASRVEVGSDAIKWHVRDATLGWFVGRYRPVETRSAEEQVEFWRHEIDRITAESPNDAVNDLLRTRMTRIEH